MPISVEKGSLGGTITPKTDKALKKTIDGERTTIIFVKFKNIDISVFRKCALSDVRSPERGAERNNKKEHLLMAKIFPIRFSRSSHDKDFSSALLKIFS